MQLSFFVISDTGFLDGDVESNDKEDLPAFAPPEEDQSFTKLAFILHTRGWDYHRTVLLEFVANKVQMRNFIKEGGSLPDNLKADCVGKCYDMACIANESEANRVLSDVIDAAKEKSWPLERK